MPTRIEKLEALASHLLDRFIHLREKYALLVPMLYNQEVINTRGANKQARGFRILRNSLFLACAQDIANLCHDDDKRTPSIRNLVAALEEPSVREELRNRYARKCSPLADDETDPVIIAALKQMDQREEFERRNQFDSHCARLKDVWLTLSTSQAVEGFRTIRDKITAHTEVQFVVDKYQLVDISTLGIKWSDLKETADTMQECIELIGMVIRDAGFAWESLDRQLSHAANGFWTVT